MSRTLTAAHEEAVTMICCSGDSRILLTGDTTGVAKVWSVAELTDACGKTAPMCVLHGCHDMGVNSADVSPVTAITSESKRLIYVAKRLRVSAAYTFNLPNGFIFEPIFSR